MLVDARNGFNDLSRLTMMWTVWHSWPAGARFTFNCYMHWAQLILFQMGEPPVTILSREGLTEGYSISMVLYGMTLFPLAEDLRVVDPGLLSTLYADDAVFDGSAQQSAHLLNMLLKRGAERGYFTKPAKYLFISDTWGKRKRRGGNLWLRFLTCTLLLGVDN